jgi:hypothetical protein
MVFASRPKHCYTGWDFVRGTKRLHKGSSWTGPGPPQYREEFPACLHLLSCRPNPCEHDRPRCHQISLLRAREQTPVRPVQLTQRRLVGEYYEGSAVAANAGLPLGRQAAAVTRAFSGFSLNLGKGRRDHRRGRAAACNSPLSPKT